jgi:predicted DNA-binding protein
MHTEASDTGLDTTDETRIALRIGRAERDRLSRLAEVYDRTLSSEVRRAVRFYLDNVETVDRALREQAEAIS